MTAVSLRLVQRHQLVVFFALAYLIAWGLLPFGSFGAFAPLLAAVIVVASVDGVTGLRRLASRLLRWRVGWYWYLAAFAVPLTVHLLTATAEQWFGDRSGSLTSTSITTVLLTFAVRLVNPTEGALGEEPGWRGYALPALQQGRTPLGATTVLAVLVAGWHLPLFFLDDDGLQPRILISGLVTTVAVTYWYAWLFLRSGRSVLMVVVAHSMEGSLQAEGWLYMIIWCAVALLLIVADRQAWRSTRSGSGTSLLETGGVGGVGGAEAARP